MRLGLGNTLVNGGVLSSDGLSLDLQFATDKTLTARKGPTPTFTRASAATYYGPLVDYGSITALTSDSINSNRSQWTGNNGSTFITIYYDEAKWVISVDTGDITEYFAALGTEFRPEQANWSASGSPFTPTTSSTFGLVRAGTNEPRFDHSTTAPNACLGLLIEDTRTNLVFPSATLTTQTRTVTATAHTLSFYGTGTVVLSGVAIATVTGTGAFPTRTTLTFTPTAGSLIMTVTGTVQFAQLEAGAFPTSYIPTTSASVVRSVDLCSITGAAFTGFYNQSEGTMFSQSTKTSTNANAFVVYASNGSFVNGLDLRYTSVTLINAAMNVASAAQFTNLQATITSGSSPKQAVAYKLNDCAYSANGAAAITDTSALIPTVSQLNIGLSHNSSQQPLNGHIASIRYFKKRLANAKLQTITA
jgi:hypothetical protein